MSRKILNIVVVLFLVWSCSDEPVETVFFDLNTENGVFISCEGNFMYGNSSLSFYNPENKTVQNQLFYARNNVPLGDVAQSLAMHENTLFIVVNNSGKIYAIDAESVKFKGVITGLTSPRYMLFISDEKAYVSDLYAHKISVVNPITYEIIGEIELLENHTSEQMVQVGKYVFATSWSYNKYLLVINSETDKLVDSIRTPFQPKNLKVDKNGKIWVLSDGGFEGSPVGDEQAALTRIDPETRTVEQIFKFENKLTRPSNLEMNNAKDTLYFIDGGVCKMSVNSNQLPDSAFIHAENKLLYNLAINPKNNEIYAVDAIDYTQDAIVYRYSQRGTLIDSFKVGINPSDFLFR